jgi:hypothetical protein
MFYNMGYIMKKRKKNELVSLVLNFVFLEQTLNKRMLAIVDPNSSLKNIFYSLG